MNDLVIANIGRIVSGDAIRAENNGVTIAVVAGSRGFETRGYRYSSFRRDPHATDRCF